MANTLDSIGGATASTAARNTPTSASAASGTQVSKNMFLQLLVAQIKNQDPLNPSDGVQFLTQLAQFQQLETSMNTAADITAIRTDLDKLAATGSGTTTGSTISN